MNMLYAPSSTRANRPISGMYAEVADTLNIGTWIIAFYRSAKMKASMYKSSSEDVAC